MTTLADRLAATLRTTAQAFAAGDQVAPRVLLWTDPERSWESAIPKLQQLLPELFGLGDYAPEQRRGPALWLRCIEARVVVGAPGAEATPIFYLPGVSREQLRAAEDCPQDLAALVELQYRGAMWLHANGKDWTPYAFLVSRHGGLDLDVAKDQATLEALDGALAALLNEPVSSMAGRRLDSEFFNSLVAPDPTGLLLRWLSDPDAFKQRLSNVEWRAFCHRCKADFRFDPVHEGPIGAARRLAERANPWDKVWQRFAESPTNYAGIVEWLKRANPKSPTMFDTAETWPEINAGEERKLDQALKLLMDRPQDEVCRRIGELETIHHVRRGYPWQKLALSPLATALEPLARLMALCHVTPGAPNADAYAEFYATEGWRVDAAAISTMAACGSPEQHGGILGIVHAAYLPWVEATARQLQQLIRESGYALTKRAKPIEAAPGRLVMFADGLRMDVAQQLTARLETEGLRTSHDWEWSAIPSVTATAKPAASPIANAVVGSDADDAFATRLKSTGQLLTNDRFVAALKERAWQVLGAGETGDPSGWAWTEAGTLDKRGHSEGWKLARSISSEIADLVSRICSLVDAGWVEVTVVTDHGWLLVPGGLPKVELKSFLAAHRWGRCAALKSEAKSDVQSFKWYWNPDVLMASPPGAGCFYAGTEYAHGGVSLQELVTPVIRVQSGANKKGSARIADAKWTGAKCRVQVTGESAGIRVDIRSRLPKGSTSFLSDRQAREIGPDGKVTVFLEDDSDIGTAADIVLLDTNGLVIDSLASILGQ